MAFKAFVIAPASWGAVTHEQDVGILNEVQ